MIVAGGLDRRERARLIVVLGAAVTVSTAGYALARRLVPPNHGGFVGTKLAGMAVHGLRPANWLTPRARGPR